MKRYVYLLLAISLLIAQTSALDNGLARTPPMGWNSWNAFQLNINEDLIKSTADAMAQLGMREAGYQYVIVDAGWKAHARDHNGKLAADPVKFPSGIKAVADYVHSKGLKFGIYTDAGSEDCVSGEPGSKDHEVVDAATFAEWGVDFVKEDWCNTAGMNAQIAYTKMSQALRATGRPMLFSTCEWGDHQPWQWVTPIANMWRTTGDIKDCWDCGRKTMNKPGGYPRGWTLILDAETPLAGFAGPGHWNDPDMLEVGARGMSLEESRAHFSLWAILAAPLIAGADVRNMKSEIAEILTNTEVIAVDQDAAGIEGTRVKSDGKREIWIRPLSDGSRAVVLFNRGSSDTTIRVQWTDIGWKSNDRVLLRDVWAHRDIATNNMSNAKGNYVVRVPAHGVVMLKASGSNVNPLRQ